MLRFWRPWSVLELCRTGLATGRKVAGVHVRRGSRKRGITILCIVGVEASLY